MTGACGHFRCCVGPLAGRRVRSLADSTLCSGIAITLSVFTVQSSGFARWRDCLLFLEIDDIVLLEGQELSAHAQLSGGIGRAIFKDSGLGNSRAGGRRPMASLACCTG